MGMVSRNGRRNPRVPMEKLSTGGTAPALNNDEAWSMVPSPPRVTTRSIGSACAPAIYTDGVKSAAVCGRLGTHHAKLLPHEVYRTYPRGTLSHRGTSPGRVWVKGCSDQVLACSAPPVTYSRSASMARITGGVRILFTMRILFGGRSNCRVLSFRVSTGGYSIESDVIPNERWGYRQ